MVKGKCTYGVLMGKPEERRPLGTPRHRWIFDKWDGAMTGLIWLRLRARCWLL
jgi:hypothetical protein